MTLRQLRRVASELQVSRYSRMRKDQLLAAIREKQAQANGSTTTISVQPVPSNLESQEKVEAAKFDLGPAQEDVLLASVDEGLGDLPGLW